MNINLDTINKKYLLSFEFDEEEYLYKNNLMNFLIYGFDIKKAFYFNACDKNNYIDFLNKYIVDKNMPLYFRIFSICLFDIVSKNNNFNIEDIFDTYILDFFEFHGVMYDLCKFAIKDYNNRYTYFEKYVADLNLFNTDNIFFKQIDIFKPFDYIINSKNKVLPISFSTITSLCFYELEQMLNFYKKPKECKYCNSFFISKNSNREYCDKLQNNNKTCFEIASGKDFKNKQFTEKTKNDKYLFEYMKAYRKIHKNKYKTPDKQLSDQDKEKLKKIKRYLDEIRNGTLTEEEYLELLKNINKN